MKQVMEQMKKDIEEVKGILADNTEKLVVLIADGCKFCKEYTDELIKMDVKNSDGKTMLCRIYNVDKDKVAKVSRVILGIDKIPSTLFINKDNKVRAVVSGVLDQKGIENIIESRMEER